MSANLWLESVLTLAFPLNVKNVYYLTGVNIASQTQKPQQPLPVAQQQATPPPLQATPTPPQATPQHGQLFVQPQAAGFFPPQQQVQTVIETEAMF